MGKDSPAGLDIRPHLNLLESEVLQLIADFRKQRREM